MVSFCWSMNLTTSSEISCNQSAKCNPTYLHSEARVVVRVSHVSDVQEPHVPHVEDLGVLLGEEGLKVLSGLDQVAEPDERRQVDLSSLEELASELN